MTDPTMDAVLSRLDALEKQNRRLKRWGAGFLLLGLALGGMAMAQEEKVPEVIKATKGFEVVGEDGKQLMVFGDYGVGLGLFSRDRDGVPLLAIQHFRDGNSEIRLAGTEGILTLSPCMVTLQALREGNAPPGQVNLSVNEGKAGLLLSGGTNGATTELGVDYDGQGGLRIQSKDGKTLFKVPE